MKTLCLNMIVKNEGKNMRRCLQHVKKYIDYYVICDTGSTDDTIDVIKDELKDIPGEILNHEWVNFGHNRTLALNAAEGKADYVIICDADEVLMFKDFDKDKLTSDCYSIRYTNTPLDYSFMGIVKNGLKWRYVGVTHEYIVSDNCKISSNLNEVSLCDFGDGGSKANKFERDIELLIQGLKDEPNNPRYMFYLANSYRDIGQYDKAIPYYQARIDNGNWIEEVTCSYEYMGECYKRLGDRELAIETWMRGYKYNPLRAECIYFAANTYLENAEYHLAYNLLLLAKDIKYPASDILFINKDIYDYLIDYALSICTYYVDRNKDVRSIFTKLIDHPSTNKENVLSNYKFYCRSMENCRESTIFFPPQIKIGGYNNSTPSILKVDDGYIVNIRNVNYALSPNGGFNSIAGYNNTINSYIKYDNNFNVLEYKVFNDSSLGQNYTNGLEDIRLYKDGETLKFIATKCYTWHQKLVDISMVNGNYDIGKPELEYKRLNPLAKPYFVYEQLNICEKNWVPFTHNGETKFVYEWNPIKVGHLDKEGRNLIIDRITPGLWGARGSTAGYIVGDEIWFIVHVVDYQGGQKRKYYHRLVILDYETLKLKRKSHLFNFEGHDYEYCLGMIVEDNRIIITHNTQEANSYIKIYNKEKFLHECFCT